MKHDLVVVLLALLVATSICAMDLEEGEVLCSAGDLASVLDSPYAAGRVKTPPDRDREWHAEVINTGTGATYWARYLMPSHKPSVEELQEGQWILWNDSFAASSPSDWAYRNQPWYFGVVTSTKEAFKGVIEVNHTRGYLQWCRLPDVPQQADFRDGEVLCAYTQEADAEKNVYAIAKVETLPAEVSRGMAQVRYADSTKVWTRYVIPSHQARADELKVGDWLLCSENFEKPRTELNYRYGNWYLMRITSLRDLSKGVVEANSINIPLEWARVPEYHLAELKSIDMEDVVREARADEALDLIRQQKLRAQKSIHMYTEQLEARRKASPEAVLTAETVKKDLEFYNGQAQQAIEVIEELLHILGETPSAVASPGQTVAAAPGEYGQVQGTKRYRDTMQLAEEEVLGLVSAVVPPALEYLRSVPSFGETFSAGNLEDQFASVRIEIEEDCFVFDPGRVDVRREGPIWTIVDGKNVLLGFGFRESEARRALQIIRNYGLSQQCFVGRPDPSLEYWLVDGRAPAGAMGEEDCIGFDPARLEIKSVDGRWAIMEGNRSLLDFGGSRAEADKALEIIRYHGFTRICSVGRPQPSFTYLRKEMEYSQGGTPEDQGSSLEDQIQSIEDMMEDLFDDPKDAYKKALQIIKDCADRQLGVIRNITG